MQHNCSRTQAMQEFNQSVLLLVAHPSSAAISDTLCSSPSHDSPMVRVCYLISTSASNQCLAGSSHLLAQWSILNDCDLFFGCAAFVVAARNPELICARRLCFPTRRLPRPGFWFSSLCLARSLPLLSAPRSSCAVEISEQMRHVNLSCLPATHASGSR